MLQLLLLVYKLFLPMVSNFDRFSLPKEASAFVRRLRMGRHLRGGRDQRAVGPGVKQSGRLMLLLRGLLRHSVKLMLCLLKCLLLRLLLLLAIWLLFGLVFLAKLLKLT
jgi:hypothetical protein